MPYCSIREALQVDLPAIHVLDIGAMAEGEDRFAGLVKEGLAHVTGFEPSPGRLHVLAARQGPYRYLPFCLGKGGPATIYVTRYPGCTSLYEPDPAVINLFTALGAEPGGNFQVLQTLDIQTHRLDDIPDLGPADYVKVDVQGAELDVLRNGTTALLSTLVLECEVEFLPLYKGQPLYGDVCVFLAGHGFVPHKLIDTCGRSLRPFVFNNNRYAPISQLLWADAIFIRDFTKLERFGDDELLKAAVILHEVYLSYDVVIHLLREYDRRTGTDLVSRYAAKVLPQPDLPTLFMNQKLHI